MFRSRGENLRSVYILLFLNVAFFFLQHQDAEKFARLFSFDWSAVLHGEAWRLFTYQFVQAFPRIGSISIPPVVTLFLNLVLLSLMGMAVEEAWGTGHFLTFFALSTLGSAAAAAYLGVPLLGSYFINFTLLFVYAALNRDQTFYLSVAIPVRVTFLAILALGALLVGVFFGNASNIAALAGATVAFLYYASQRVRRPQTAAPSGFAPAAEEPDPLVAVTRNVTRVAAMKKALATQSDAEIDRLIAMSENEVVVGVNICAPVDFKPEHSDRYCVRCEGFAECSARHLRLNRAVIAPDGDDLATAR
jgi:membrane associated rhomboid family serine protease